VVCGWLIGKGGLTTAIALLALPMGMVAMGYIFKNAYATLIGALAVGFFSAGIGRYVAASWGLLVDIFLTIGWLSLAFRKKMDWSPLKNDVMYVTIAWFGLVILEIVNPESNGFECWFYAMRGDGFYQLLCFGLVFLVCQDKKYMDKLLVICTVFSVMGTLWGLRQFIFGVDEAEHRWLYVEGFAFTHMLHGVLRVFSFYSDAGQFGSSQAMFALLCGIVAQGPISKKAKAFYITAAVLNFIGFGISGTRGAVAVPAVGILVFLFMSRNFKILIIGMIVAGGAFYFLKYTKGLQHVEQVRRMRTAFDPNDASLQVRLTNQKTFGRHLATRPFGGGIGAAGFWGYRYAPHSLLGNTATDSYYVKIWAETGLVGLCLHLFMFGYFVGKGGYIVYTLRDQALRFKAAGIYCSMCGIFLSSYGNQVYSQMPTGIVMGVLIPLIFLAPKYDDDLDAERALELEKPPLVKK
jgi:O-Antigen ligase